MLKLKGCPRCGGDLASDPIDRGEFSCMACGHVIYASVPQPFVRERQRKQRTATAVK